MSDNSNEKIRALFLAGLMVFSVFAGTTAIAGTAAANVPGSAGNTSFDPGEFSGDETATANALSGENTEIADLDFSGDNGGSGTVSDVFVNASFGSENQSISPEDIDSVTVQLRNGTSVEATNTTSYDQSGLNVSFDNVSDVDRIQVLATFAGAETVDGNEVVDAGVEIFDATTGQSFGGNSPYDTSGTQNLSTNAGFITGQVEDTNGEPIENANVDIVNADTGAVAAQITTSSDGTFDPSRVEVAPGNNYTVNVDQFGFTTFSREVFVGSGETRNVPVTLSFNLVADTLRVETFEDGAATGETTATLFANGESDNTRQYVAILENESVEQSDTPITESRFQGETIELSFDDSGVGDFVDNGENNTDLSVETNQVGDVDDDGFDESFVTFSVTSDVADESNVSQALTQETITAEAPDTAADTNNSAVTQYVLEGEESISGQVLDQSGDPVENATVYASLNGVSNESLAFTQQTFVNDDGESFLVGTTGPDGNYAIPGIAGDNTTVTLYVVADGFNRLDRTGTSVDRFVAAADEEQTAGDGAENEEHNFVLTDVEVILDFRVSVTAQDSESGEFVDPASVPIQDSTPVQIDVEVKTQNSPDSDFESIGSSDLVDSVDVNLTQDNPQVGNIASSVTVSESGTNVSFEAVTAGETNVNATVTNSEDEEFSDEVTIDAFGVGQIAGNVINDENPADNLPDANVTLFEVTGDGLEQLDTTTSGPGGSYSFTEVRTGNEYRVEAEFGGQDGFAEIIKSQAGTTNADIVVVGVDPDAANFVVSGLDPSDATVNNSETFTVSATVENDGDLESTQAVRLLVSGTEIASQDVTLAGGDSQTVEFTVDAGEFAPGNYTHEVATENDAVTGSLEIQDTSSQDEPLPTLPGEDSPVTDTNGDELYEDLNGDGTFDIRDVSVFLDHYQSDEVQSNTDLFDFNGDGTVDIRDVAELLDQTV